MNNYFKKKNISVIIPWIILILLSIPVMATGCHFYTADRNIARERHEKDEEKILERGYMAFQVRDFKQAAKLFRSLKSTTNKEISKKAHYALACTKWALAETPDDEKKAFVRWEKIKTGSYRYGDRNEFKLLETLLKVMRNRSCQERGSKEVLNQTEASRCQFQLYLKEEKIKQLNQRIKTIKGKVFLLKKKIKTIEEIDQKIQEKKEDPPPP